MRALLKSVWIIAALGLAISPAAAQIRTVDPNSAIDADLDHASPSAGSAQPSAPPPTDQGEIVDPGTDSAQAPAGNEAQSPAANATPAQQVTAVNGRPPSGADTYKRDDVIAGAEGVFGKGAEGLAGMVEKILRDQGEPNAYIAGREAAGALGVGLRYGSGTLFHKVEGQRPVYWTGPSIGFDAGGDANKVFVLVYNLFDSQELYKRFPAAEGRLYLIGGFAATYLRRGDIVLIPIRLGVGWRVGANVGYVKFSEKSRWLPF